MFGMALSRRLHRVVSFSWSSPVPNAGQWLGSIPAGCEVCRGKPAEVRAPPWIAVCPNQYLTEKPSCEAGHKTAPDHNAKTSSQPLQCGSHPHRTFRAAKTDIRRLTTGFAPESGRTPRASTTAVCRHLQTSCLGKIERRAHLIALTAKTGSAGAWNAWAWVLRQQAAHRVDKLGADDRLRQRDVRAGLPCQLAIAGGIIDSRHRNDWHIW